MGHRFAPFKKRYGRAADGRLVSISMKLRREMLHNVLHLGRLGALAIKSRVDELPAERLKAEAKAS